MAFSKKNEVVKGPIEVRISDPTLCYLKKPFCMIIAGSSQAGKTHDILSWLQKPEKIFESPFERIVYICGSGKQKAFTRPGLEKIIFTEDLSLLTSLEYTEGGQLLILDDVLTEISEDKQLIKIATAEVHHKNVSLMVLTQTIFMSTGPFKLLKENTQYFYIKNHTNPFKLKVFANQIGLNTQEFILAYNYIMNKSPYSGLLVDLCIRSGIRPLTPLRYDLVKGNLPRLLISNEMFHSNINLGRLKKINEKIYIYEVLKNNENV